MRSLSSLLAVCLILGAAHCASAAQFEQKWIFLTSNLRTADGVDRTLYLLEKSAAAGCTHALLTDSSHLVAFEMPWAYWEGIERVKEKAASLNMTLIPTIFPTGYGGRYLNFDSNLAAGLRVTDAPFLVRGGTATPDPASVPEIVNGAFEDFENNTVTGWSGQEGAGETTFVDTQTARSGRASLRVVSPPATDQERPAGASVTLSQRLAVEPFKSYRVSFWIKSDGPDGSTARPNIAITSNEGRRRHIFPQLRPGDASDWTRTVVVFNTLDATELRLTVGVGASPGATAWLDDVTIEPLGLTGVLRRRNTPVRVTSADGTVVYEEGKDFERIEDPQGRFSETRDGPPLRLTANSRIRDGSTVLVSWYHPVRIHGGQINLTISDPAVFEMMDTEMEAAKEVWDAEGYFMNIDEIRLAGWEEGPDGPDQPVSQMLADYTRKAVDIVREHAPDATIYTWSDMYTPFHNARPLTEGSAYYLVNGSYAEWEQFLPDEVVVEGRWEGPVSTVVQGGAWEGLPAEVQIMLWHARDNDAVRWFADRGHKQIICGFYDVRGTDGMKRNIQQWMTRSEGVPNIIGMMYTTWAINYDSRQEFIDSHDNIPEFFELVDSYPDWVE